MVAIHHRALGIHGQASIGVAIVSQSQIGTVLLDRSSHLINMRGATIIIDVIGIRVVMNSDDLCPGRLIRHGSNRRCSTISTVHNNLNTGKIAWHRFLQMVKVVLLRIHSFFNDPTNTMPHGTRFG